MFRSIACALAMSVLTLPAFAADTTTDAPPDPFAKLDAAMPPLSCMERSPFEAALKAAGASKLEPLSLAQAMFYRGYYAAQIFTAPGYPIGDGVEIQVFERADRADHGAQYSKVF